MSFPLVFVIFQAIYKIYELSETIRGGPLTAVPTVS